MTPFQKKVIDEVGALLAPKSSLISLTLCARLGEDTARAHEINTIVYEEFGSSISMMLESQLRHDDVMAALRRLANPGADGVIPQEPPL
jgi:hypothetical protein